MKKSLFCGLLFIAGILSAQESTAERTSTSKIRFGATGNVHHSSIKGIHNYSKGRTAGGIGVFAQFPIDIAKEGEKESQFYLQPQLEFSMDGEKATPQMGDQKFYNNYIALPILIKYYFDFSKESVSNDWFVGLGPQFAFAVTNKREGNLYIAEDILADKSFNKFNFGLVAVGGYKINNNFEAFLRYDQGLNKVYKDFTFNKTWNYKLGLGINYYF